MQTHPQAPAARLLARRLLPALIALALGSAYALTLAPGITWANQGADSGDLVAATATLGVAHPSGYPSYLLLARIFQLLPLGDLALRSTIFSAVAAILAALCMYLLLLRLLAGQPWSMVCAGLAALACGLAPLFWSQAVIAEVYSLNALFVALLLLFALGCIQRPATESRARTHALVAGLALGNHVTVVVVVLAWFALATVYTPAPERLRLLLRRVLWMSLGLLVYLYLPLRAMAQPPLNWGDPRDWSGFWWEISGQPYRDLAFGLPPDLLYGRVAAWAALLVQQYSWPGLVLGALGLFYGARAARPFVWASAAVAVLGSVFAIGYNTDDSYAYLLPAFMIFAIWMGLGLQLVLAALARLHKLAAPGAALLCLLALAWRSVAVAPQVDASQDRRAIVFADAALAAAPRGALVIADSDLDTFPLWYAHYARGQRPDLAVLVDPLLDFDWYRRNLRATYPDLRIPDTEQADWLSAIAAANPQRGAICHTHPMSTPVLTCEPIGKS